jgi:transcriptional regulator with XRE-family HTH domain
MSTNRLGEYLRARREQVTPEQAGIPEYGVRRVPGLRREEVAMLAGISADYYLRLERGRDRNPSVQVLESIAQVLQLDDDHFAHLLTLVADVPRQRKRRARREPRRRVRSSSWTR